MREQVSTGLEAMEMEEELRGVVVRVRQLLDEKRQMAREIEMLKRMGFDTVGLDVQMVEKEEFGRFAAVYERVGGDVSLAVRETLSEGSEAAASVRNEEIAVETEEDGAEMVETSVQGVLLRPRRASWS